jgi:hypothetical protein
MHDRRKAKKLAIKPGYSKTHPKDQNSKFDDSRNDIDTLFGDCILSGLDKFIRRQKDTLLRLRLGDISYLHDAHINMD